MHLTYDPAADAVYIRLRDMPYAHGVDLDHSRRVDFGPDGAPIGVELLNVSSGVDLRDIPDGDAIGRLLAEHAIRVLV